MLEFSIIPRLITLRARREIAWKKGRSLFAEVSAERGRQQVESDFCKVDKTIDADGEREA